MKTAALFLNFLIAGFVTVCFNFIAVRGQDGSVIDGNPNKFQFEKTIYFGFAAPDGRERAAVESESLLSKLDGHYVRTLNSKAAAHNLQPVVDTISGEQKFSNDGAVGRRGATLILKGFDGIANVLNGVLDTPTNAQAQVGKEITAALNRIGGSLVGL